MGSFQCAPMVLLVCLYLIGNSRQHSMRTALLFNLPIEYHPTHESAEASDDSDGEELSLSDSDYLNDEKGNVQLETQQELTSHVGPEVILDLQ